MKAVVTQAMRALDARKVWYRATTYDEDGAFHTAEDAAAMLGVSASAMYKTLIALRENAPRAKPILVMAPSDSEIDLKLLARSVGAKKVRMAPQQDAERLTGMQAGGISALGLQRPAAFEILIEERAGLLETIHISAGVRGVELELRTADLVRLTNARFVSASRPA